MGAVRVLVADDYTIFRQGLVKLLEHSGRVQVIGEAGDGLEAEAKARELRPDVVVMEVRMPGQDGIETARHITDDLPGTRVLFLTISQEDSDIFRAMQTGARGYLLKTLSLAEVEEAIITVSQGYAAVSPPKMLAKLITSLAAPRNGKPLTSALSSAGLSSREKEILRFVAVGATNREIASRLFIAETTVKAHVGHILDKVNVQNRVELASVALKEGWVSERRCS